MAILPSIQRHRSKPANSSFPSKLPLRSVVTDGSKAQYRRSSWQGCNQRSHTRGLADIKNTRHPQSARPLLRKSESHHQNKTQYPHQARVGFRVTGITVTGPSSLGWRVRGPSLCGAVRTDASITHTAHRTKVRITDGRASVRVRVIDRQR